MFNTKQTKKLTWLAAAFAILLTVACKDSGNKDKKTPEGDKMKTSKKYIRKNAYDPAAANDLNDLIKAFEQMRKLDCSNPLSWYYQGAIHQVPDTVLNKNPFCPGYITVKDTLPAWDNCTHTGDDTEFWNFAVWHRLYTWHLEKIVRKLSGNADFALPYWGYCDTVNVAQNRTMPPAFRVKGNSLYEASRFDSLNNGQPVSGTYTKYLSLKKLFQNRDYFLFDQSLDFAPHGMMHNYIGGGNLGETLYNPIYQDTLTEGGGLMAQVNSAGFDPVFFVHHAEIDRIWQQWTNSDRGKEITLDQLKASPWTYVFYDENGNRVVYSPEDIMAIIYTLDYDYDDTPVKPRAETDPLLKTRSFFMQPLDTFVRQKVGQKVTGNSLNFSISNKKPSKVNLLGTADNKSKDAQIAVLTIKVSFPSRVTGMYDVYVNLPAGTSPDHNGNYYAGAMNFFGREHVHGRGGHMGHGDTRHYATFRFDLTDEFLVTEALQKDKFNISIFKNHGRKDEEITIEEVSISTH